MPDTLAIFRGVFATWGIHPPPLNSGRWALNLGRNVTSRNDCGAENRPPVPHHLGDWLVFSDRTVAQGGGASSEGEMDQHGQSGAEVTGTHMPDDLCVIAFSGGPGGGPLPLALRSAGLGPSLDDGPPQLGPGAQSMARRVPLTRRAHAGATARRGRQRPATTLDGKMSECRAECGAQCPAEQKEISHVT